MSLTIDRKAAISLALGMAAASCNTGPGPAVAANVVEIPPQPPQPGDGGAGASATPLASADRDADAALRGPRADGTGSAPIAHDDDDDDDLGSPSSEGGVSIAAGHDAGCGFVDPKKVSRPTTACVEDQGTAGSCNVMKTCSGFPFPKQQCEDFKKAMKPKVAQRLLDCLGKLSAKQVCDACNTYRCGDLALKTSCPDPAADADCVQITTKCRSVSMVDCKMYLSGMSAAGRAKMVSCLTNRSGCGFGIYSCVESL